MFICEKKIKLDLSSKKCKRLIIPQSNYYTTKNLQTHSKMASSYLPVVGYRTGGRLSLDNSVSAMTEEDSV